jgi:radical SAM-linked protein
MGFETPTVDPPSSPANAPPFRDKVRFRFRKDGALRWISHHDLLRNVERMLRRANLPFRSTEGFHPHPRMSFALAMPLGVIGCEEVLELEMAEHMPVEEIRARLASQCPPGLQLLSIRRIDPRSNAQVRRLGYRCRIPADCSPTLQQQVRDVLAETDCWVQRLKPAPRQVNLRPLISELILAPASPTELMLEMILWLRPEGTARPDEVLQLLGLREQLTQGLVLERSRLELHDEMSLPQGATQ